VTKKGAKIRSGKPNPAVLMSHSQPNRSFVAGPWRFIVAIAVSLILAICAIKLVFLPGTSFDAARWRDDQSAWDNSRVQMGRRLVARGELIGKTRSDVISMLGKPDSSTPVVDRTAKYWNADHYFLGADQGLLTVLGLSSPFGFEWLQVRYDAGGRVGATEIYEFSSAPFF